MTTCGEFAYLSGMRFTEDQTSGINVIRAYGAGELRINENRYREALIVNASTVVGDLALQDIGALSATHIERILALAPEIVLLGTGARQIFPHAAVGAQFLRAGIGFEVMDTGAACRTFNVLVGERRNVAALLLM